MKKCAIILAGGRGKRMDSNISKQFIKINDEPIIYYTLKAFKEFKEIDEITVVLPKDEIEYFKNNILNKYNLKIDNIVEGGEERQDSVYNGLKSLKDCDIVLIHDSARPFISKSILKQGIKFAEKFGACAPGVVPKDTIKIKEKSNFSKKTPNRNDLCAVQTPQCFKYDLIMKCHEEIKKQNISVTDDTMVVEYFGEKVYLFDGEYTNIKITTPEDLILAEWMVKHQG